MSTVTQLPQQFKPSGYAGCEGLGAPEVIVEANITYRQLDYWTATKRVHCHHHVGEEIVAGRGGTGTAGCWSLDQVKIMKRVKALLLRGLELNHAFILATNRQATAALLAELTYIQADLIEETETCLTSSQ